MKKQKFKITSEVHKSLLKLAGELPVTAKRDKNGAPVYKRGVVDGSEVSADKGGKKGIPGVKYSAMVLSYEPHFENLVNAFKADGQAGVDNYANYIRSQHSKRQVAVEKMRENTSWFGRLKLSIKKIFRVY